MKTFFALTAFVFTAFIIATSNARALDIRRIEIVEYGIYTVDKKSCSRDAQGIERCDRSNVRHAATTWNVPAQIGVEFGLLYRVAGAPNGSPISVKRVWRLPEPGFRSPSADKPVHSLDREDVTKIGDTVFVSYGFDDTWELVPGPWILEFWYGDRKLDERRFVITRP
jgi:hypothetical protein